MENLFKALAIVLGIAFPLSFTLPARGDTQSIVVIENDWPPYYFGTHQSKPPGFAREVIDHCLANTEYVAEYTFFSCQKNVCVPAERKYRPGPLLL